MKHLISPNKWSCLPTAFAMVLNIPLQMIITRIGHDGSEKIFPKLNDPYCRRSFHIQELIQFALRWYGIGIVHIQPQPLLGVHINDVDVHPLPKTDMQYYYDNYEGVITGLTKSGRPHAAAWNRKECLDPNGMIYPLEFYHVEAFWIPIRRMEC